MKKLILFTAITLIFTSCKYESPQSTQTVKPKENVVNFEEGFMLTERTIGELEYNGHLYGYTSVHGGISMFHAGHCKCNFN
jgi:hypothetical protein